MTSPRIIVMSGLPGAGKSTTSHLLGQRLGRSAHVEADRLQDLIVVGDSHPTMEGVTDEATEQLALRLRNAALLARSFYGAGFTAIIDDIIHGHRYEQLMYDLDGLPVHFVMLLRDLDVMKSIWREMKSPLADSWDWIDEEIREKTPRGGLWLDATHLTIDQTVDAIVSRLDEAQLPPQ